jgi:ankyrin repeat protein
MTTSEQLLDAIERNDIATASSLISSSVVNLSGEQMPLLHRATELGCVEIMALLLDAGADINAVDIYQQSACHVAISYSRFDALKLLVDRGASLGVVDSDGDSLLDIVRVFKKSEQFAVLLLDAGAPIDGLSNDHLMSLVKSVAVFNRLLARGVNFRTLRDNFGCSLCHYVARNVTSEQDLVGLIRACGIDAVHERDNNGGSPLHQALFNINESAMRVLVEFGADIDRQDNWGCTALIDAAEKMTSSRVELVSALGADASLVTNSGQAACHLAALNRHRLSLCALVAAGGDLYQPNKDGETPRMIAIRENVALPSADEIDLARRRISKTRVDLVRDRAFQICVGLHPLDINALQLCEILKHSFGAVGSLIAFHQWWAIATKVKHFRDHKQKNEH